MNLDIAFPGVVQVENGELKIDLNKPFDNIIKIDKTDYIPYYLNNLKPGNRGANSFIVKLVNAQNIEEDDIFPETPDLILKVCKFWKGRAEHVRSKRFKIEIDALIKCEKFPNVGDIYHHGLIHINTNKKFTGKYRYYTMDYAEMDLTQYLIENKLALSERLELAIDICQSLQQLWSADYYHRDIKPDNILFTNNSWIISDLGLADNRNLNTQLDFEAEWIGPRGWMSPEAMNKFLCEGKPWEDLHDIEINHQSDIFQLGKVLWFILQGNVPEGGIRRKDFLIKNDSLYQVIRTMLNNSKMKRIKSISDVLVTLRKEYKKSLKGEKVGQDLSFY